MKPIRVGIVAESTGLAIRLAVAQAAKMTSHGVQADALGNLAPDALGTTGRREFRTILRSYGQQLAALNIPLRNGLDVATNLQPRLEQIRTVMELAAELGTRCVVLPCPKLPTNPDDEQSPRATTMREALLAIAGFGDRIGVVAALEIGFDSTARVRDYFATFATGSLKVTFDPANLLVHGHDPVNSLGPLQGLIAHVHARDARAGNLSRGIQEVPLGAGDVDWLSLTATLQVLDYEGFMVVEREPCEGRIGDVAGGVKFLQRFVPPMLS